jgi:hypothetical protein
MSKKLFIFPTLIGSLFVVGFMAAIASRPNNKNTSQMVSTLFESPVVTRASDRSPDRTLKQSSTSSEFNFPKASCGDKPIKGENTWYPVFVDGGDLNTIRNQFCADAVSTVRESSKVKSVQLASFTTYNKALEFAKAVGGEVGQTASPELNKNTSDKQKARPGFASQTPDSPPISKENNTSDPLTLTAFYWQVNSADFVEFEGQVTNNSEQPIRSLQALAEFYTADGQFITSGSTFMNINPLMPGQTTSFKGFESFNPQIDKVQIRFKTFNGEISFTDARTKSQVP